MKKLEIELTEEQYEAVMATLKEQAERITQNEFVKIPNRAYEVSKYLITQHEYMTVMGKNPSSVKGDNFPVTDVAYEDVLAYIEEMNKKDDGYTYRLMSEDEFEYCAGEDPDPEQLGDYAWYNGNSGNKIQEVGKKKPNAFGLHDMLGLVLEFTSSIY